MTTLVLGIAGAVAGGALAGPLGISVALGASIGWGVGAFIGQSLNPQKVQGPRLSDLKTVNSEYGQMQPIGFGTWRQAPNIIWADEKKETAHTSGGKGGGGPKVTTYTYSQSFALRWCEGPDVEILRLWATGRLVWAADGSADLVTFVHYDGNEAQLPDPTIEAVKGVGNVPGYRGLSYTVFTDLELDQFGNMLPNWTAELHRGPTDPSIYEKVYRKDLPIAFGGTDSFYGHGDVPRLTSWPMHGDDPITVAVTSAVAFVGYFGHLGSATFNRETLDIISADLGPAGTFYYDQQETGPQALSGYDSVYTAPEYNYPYIGKLDGVDLWIGTRMLVRDWSGLVGVPAITKPTFSSERPFWDGFMRGSTDTAHAIGLPIGLLVVGAVLSADEKCLLILGCSSPTFSGGGVQDPALPYWVGAADVWYKVRDGAIADYGTVDPPLGSPASIGVCFGNTGAGGIAAASMENNYRWIWMLPTTDSVVRIYHIDDQKNLAIDEATSTATSAYWQPNGAYSIARNSQTYTNGIYHGDRVGIPETADDATATGGWATPSDLGHGAGGIVSVLCTNVEGYCGFVEGTKIGLLRRRTPRGELTYADIVAEISEREEVGLTAEQYDVTQIPDPVTGYVIGNQMTARAAIESCMLADFFDAVESDGRAKFVKRGGASVATIAIDDMGAHESGSDPVGKIERRRMAELELPVKYDVNFTDEDADYQNGNQHAQRETTYAVDTQTLNLAIAMNARTAKQIAQAHLYASWYGRDTGHLQLPAKYAYLEPTDVITLAEDGKTYRIEQRQNAMGGVMKLELRADLAALWFQLAAVPSPGSGGGTVTPPLQQLTDLYLLDLPLHPGNPANQQVYYAAMQGQDRPTWTGAGLFKSVDGGVNYDQLLVDSGPADRVGVASDVLPDFTGGGVFDEVSRLTVVMTAGSADLASVTRAQALNGANLFLVGDELVIARDCTLTAPSTYLFSGFLRGQFGTEWAMAAHGADELVIALPVTTEIAAVFAEYFAARDYKAVTIGQTLASAANKVFTNTGRALKCYAPVRLRGGRNAAGDITLYWDRRARVNNVWLPGIDVPLDESIERYMVRFWSSGSYATMVYEELHAGPPYAYSAADQTTDFGAPQAPLYWSVRQVGTLGEGYEARGVT